MRKLWVSTFQQIVEFITNLWSITKGAKPLNSEYLLVAPRSGKKKDRPRSRPRVPVLAPAGLRVLLKPVSNRVIARKLKREQKNFFFGSVTLTLRRNSIEITLRIAVHVLLYSKRTRARKRLLRRLVQWDRGRDPLNQNFRKFRSKTQWIGLVQPEKFRKNWSTYWCGPLFPVGLVWILVEWIAPRDVLRDILLPALTFGCSVALRYSLKRFSRDEMSDTTGKVRKLYKQLT